MIPRPERLRSRPVRSRSSSRPSNRRTARPLEVIHRGWHSPRLCTIGQLPGIETQQVERQCLEVVHVSRTRPRRALSTCWTLIGNKQRGSAGCRE